MKTVYYSQWIAPLAIMLYGDATEKIDTFGKKKKVIEYDRQAYSNIGGRFPLIDILSFSDKLDQQINLKLREKNIDVEVFSTIVGGRSELADYSKLFNFFGTKDDPYMHTGDENIRRKVKDIVTQKKDNGIYGSEAAFEALKYKNSMEFIGVKDIEEVAIDKTGFIPTEMDWQAIRDQAEKSLWFIFNYNSELKGLLTKEEFFEVIYAALEQFQNINGKGDPNKIKQK